MTDELFDELKPKGWISDFIEKVHCDIPEVNPEWILSCAESLFASCCHKQYTNDKIGKLRLGVWNLAIAPSGEWKTVVLKYFCKPIIKHVQEKTGNLLYLGRFTEESLIQHMMWHEIEEYDPDLQTETKNKETGKVELEVGGFVKKMVRGNVGLFVRDEFTNFFSGQKTKGWLSGLSEILSEVYDTEIDPRHTIKHGWQRVPYCNYSFVSATTRAIYNKMTKDYFTQGLGNRMDFCPFGKGKKVKRETEDFFAYKNLKIREEDVRQLGNGLTNLLSSPLTYIGFDDEAKPLWINFKEHVDRMKLNIPDTELEYSYLNRQSEKALRRACIYVLSENTNSVKNLTDLLVQPRHMKLAIIRQKKLFENFKTVLEEWELFKDDNKPSPKTTEKARKKILLNAKLLGLMSKTLLAKECDYNKNQKEFTDCIAQLVSEGELRVIWGEKGEESRLLIAKMNLKERKKQFVKDKPRGNPPVFYKYTGK